MNTADAQSSARTVVGRPFQPGSSGNPGGRPPGLARLAREATGDGVDVVGFFTLVSRGTKPEGWPDGEKLTADHMIDANRWLADRGWGKAALQIEGWIESVTITDILARARALERDAIDAESRFIPEDAG